MAGWVGQQMSRVIQMFREDELTGMRVPNVNRKPEFMICGPIDERVQAIAIFPTRNQAMAYRAKMKLSWTWIEEI